MTHDFQPASLRDGERRDDLSHAETNALMLQQLSDKDDVESKEGGDA